MGANGQTGNDRDRRSRGAGERFSDDTHVRTNGPLPNARRFSDDTHVRTNGYSASNKQKRTPQTNTPHSRKADSHRTSYPERDGRTRDAGPSTRHSRRTDIAGDTQPGTSIDTKAGGRSTRATTSQQYQSRHSKPDGKSSGLFSSRSPLFYVVVGEAILIIVLLIVCISSCSTINVLRQEALARSAAKAEAAAQAEATVTPAGDGVSDRWVASGVFASGNSELDTKVKDFCDSFSDDDLSAEENFYTTFRNISYYDFYTDDYVNNPQGSDWTIKWALDMLNNDKGDCYSSCALVQWCARYFGYSDAQAYPAMVLTQSGGYGEHGFSIMTMDGEQYLFDATKGTNGWKLNTDYYTYFVRDV